MIIGVRAHDYGKELPTKLFSAIANDGWKTVQLAFPKAIEGVDSFDDVTPEIITETKKAMELNDISIAVLGVYVDPALTDNIKRKEQVRLLHQSLPYAMLLGAGCVGTETSTRNEHADIKALYRSLEELLPEAERLKVNIGIEPVHKHTLHTPELTKQMLNDFTSPNLKIIFDPINLLTPDLIDTQNDLWKKCIDSFGSHIAAIHMKGATGEVDNNGMLANAPLASSILDHKALFNCLKYINAPILREAAEPANAADDIAFIQKCIEKYGEKTAPVHHPI